MIGAAPAKINLALVVGPLRDDGKHELVTVYQRVDLGDRISVEPAAETTVDGFADDTIVRGALAALDAPHGWRVRIEKRIPVAAGPRRAAAPTRRRRCGSRTRSSSGRSSRPSCTSSPPGSAPTCRSSSRDGPQLGTGDGTQLEPLDLPQDFAVLLCCRTAQRKQSTAAVYAAFDARGGAAGFDERAAALRAALGAVAPSARPRRSCRRTTSRARRSRSGCARSERSAPTSAGPGRWSTGSSTGGPTREAAARRISRAAGGLWITVPAWYG